MVMGTGSSTGKTTVVTALCRLLVDRGNAVAPFKSQNMSSKYITLPTGGKIGVGQYLQGIAARRAPDAIMNPILLVPNSDTRSKVVLMGKDWRDYDAFTYHAYKAELRPFVVEAYETLASQVDYIIIEGAGSPAEINLMENDFVNTGMAEIADAPVLLVADIDRGGVFAAIYGTVMLLPEKDRRRIKGFLINKFRGDVTILEPGIRQLEELLGIVCVGVLPYLNVGLADEDSLVDGVEKTYDPQESVEGAIDALAAEVVAHCDVEEIFSWLSL